MEISSAKIAPDLRERMTHAVHEGLIASGADVVSGMPAAATGAGGAPCEGTGCVTEVAKATLAAYVARGAVNNAGNVARTRKMLLRAFESQIAGEGFSFVEILTMCPTGWFIETQDAPDYLAENLGSVHGVGVLKDRRAGTPA